jgi:hypothetical protein
MARNRNKAASSVFFSFLLLVTTACYSGRKTTDYTTVLNDAFAFVEYYQTTDALVLAGEYRGGRRIDSPTYAFNPEDRTLNIYRYPDRLQPDSAIVVLGVGKILKNAAGSGVSSFLVGANQLPFSYNDLTITSLSNDKLSLTYQNKSITLKAGEEWKHLTEKTDTLKLQGLPIIKTMQSTSIRFHGFLPRNAIRK